MISYTLRNRNLLFLCRSTKWFQNDRQKARDYQMLTISSPARLQAVWWGSVSCCLLFLMTLSLGAGGPSRLTSGFIEPNEGQLSTMRSKSKVQATHTWKYSCAFRLMTGRPIYPSSLCTSSRILHDREVYSLHGGFYLPDSDCFNSMLFCTPTTRQSCVGMCGRKIAIGVGGKNCFETRSSATGS